MMPRCLFCDIVTGKEPAHRVWEDEHHLAFLSIFPNTPGVTVVIPKIHRPSYAFALAESELAALVLAAKKVALLLDACFDDVGRTALVLEGFGIDHVHAKLFPLHGTPKHGWHSIHSTDRTIFERYPGYVASNDGLRADDLVLATLAERVRKTASAWQGCAPREPT